MGQELMFDQYAYSIKVRSDKAPQPEAKKKPQAAPTVPDDSDLNLNDLDLDSLDLPTDDTEDAKP